MKEAWNKMYLTSTTVFLSMLIIARARITIDVNIGKNLSDIILNYSGDDEAVIGEKELKLFKIDKNNLQKAIKRIYNEKPNHVYLKNPTSTKDIYQKYQLKQVTRLLKVKSVKVKDSTVKSIMIMSQNFENLSNNTIKFKPGISGSVENSISTSWPKNKEITLSQEIEYDLNIFINVSVTKNFTYASNWGKNSKKSDAVTLGIDNGMEIQMQSGQTATSILTANRCSLDLEVEYVLSLQGNAAVVFKKKHQGHNVHGPTIESILKNANLQAEFVIIESIQLGFFADASLKVFDEVTGLPL